MREIVLDTETTGLEAHGIGANSNISQSSSANTSATTKNSFGHVRPLAGGFLGINGSPGGRFWISGY
jgi:hypothetical protein